MLKGKDAVFCIYRKPVTQGFNVEYEFKPYYQRRVERYIRYRTFLLHCDLKLKGRTPILNSKAHADVLKEAIARMAEKGWLSV